MRDLFEAMERLDALMDVSTLRHRVISGNIANVNTPGFTRRRIAFEEVLRERAARGEGDPRDVDPRVVEDRSGVTRVNGNNVEIEEETGALNKNALLYQTYARAHQVHRTILRLAISPAGSGG